MADVSDFLPTPENYATPNQVAATREYAKALLGIGKNDVNQPINHWTQGLSNMVHALVGGNELYRAGQQEKAMDLAAARTPPAAATPEIPVRQPPAARAASYSGDPEDNPDLVPTPVKTESISNPFPGGVPVPQPRPDAAPANFNGRWPSPGDTMTNFTMPGQSSALPFDAETSARANAGIVAPNAPSAIAMALKGGGQKLPFGAPPTQAPPEQYVDPRTIPARPTVSRAQFEAALANRYMDPDVKKMIVQQYYEQFQPREVEGTGGKVIVGPGGVQRFVPTIVNRKFKGSDVEIEEPDVYVPHPDGTLTRRSIPLEGAGPGTSGTPAPAAPSSGPSVKGLNDAKALKYAPDAPETPDVAATPGLPNEIKFGTSQAPAGAPEGAADALPPGMLGMAPPDFPTSPPTPAEGAGGKGVQTAQISPEMQSMADWAQKRKLDFERQKEYNAKDIDSFSKTYEQLSLAGQRAAQSLPSLEMAKNIIKDPRFYSGIGGEGLVLPFKQLQAQFGKDPTMAAPMEVFRKVISGQLIDDMKITLQGLGQVRVAEIDLLSKAAGSLGTSRAANEAVLDLMMRAHKQVDMLSNVANDYRQGYRLDKDGNMVMTNEPPTKAGLDATLKKFTNAFPLLSKEERANYEKLFNQNEGKSPHSKELSPKVQQLRSTINPDSRVPTGPTGSPEPPQGFK